MGFLTEKVHFIGGGVHCHFFFVFVNLSMSFSEQPYIFLWYEIIFQIFVMSPFRGIRHLVMTSIATVDPWRYFQESLLVATPVALSGLN